jgi:hypothetical protein
MLRQDGPNIFLHQRSIARYGTCRRRGWNLGPNQGGVSPNDCLRSTLEAGIFAWWKPFGSYIRIFGLLSLSVQYLGYILVSWIGLI